MNARHRPRTLAVAAAAVACGYVAVATSSAVVATPPLSPLSAAAPDAPTEPPYDPMTAYVDTLIYWANHPDWMPDSGCTVP